jgi:DNA-binding response OmpR family regulator
MSAKVLVIDDDECIRELLWLHLRSAGYEVQVAEDAIVGGYALLRTVPDLIICDVNMPYMDGFQFVAALRADATLPCIPVIFLSARENGEDLASDIPGCEYMMKPIFANLLLAAVARRLDRDKLPAASASAGHRRFAPPGRRAQTAA